VARFVLIDEYRNWIDAIEPMPREKMRVLSIALVTLQLLAAATSVAEPADSARAEARVHFRNGARLIRAGAYDAAVAEFSEAYRLYPNERIHYDLAQAYRLKHDDAQAIVHYRRYLAAVHEGELALDARQQLTALGAPAEETKGETEGLTALRASVDAPRPSTPAGRDQAIELGSAAPSVLGTDGTPPSATEPGPTAPPMTSRSEPRSPAGSSPTATALTTAAHASLPPPGSPQVRLDSSQAPAKPRPRPAYKKWWPWTIGGVALIGGAIGLGLALNPHSPAPTIGKVTF
jgi:hypothetical protein